MSLKVNQPRQKLPYIKDIIALFPHFTKVSFEWG
jgi:hypothetical protein